MSVVASFAVSLEDIVTPGAAKRAKGSAVTSSSPISANCHSPIVHTVSLVAGQLLGRHVGVGHRAGLRGRCAQASCG